jgi:hypothetical protein
MKGFTDIGGPRYIPSRYGLMETTHVFPTLSGGVGAIDWSGNYSSRVIEILGWPKSALSFLLAWDYDPGEGVFLDPPLDVIEYDEVAISLINMGEAAVTGTLYESALPTIFTSESTGAAWSTTLARFEVAGGETRRLELPTKGRSFLRLFLKRSDRQKPTKVNAIVSYV